MEDIDIIKQVIDEFITLLDKSDKLKCPESSRKSYYLKCCHLVWAYQVGNRVAPNDVIKENLINFKEWMPLLREAKQ
jgi:hypothetical protein